MFKNAENLNELLRMLEAKKDSFKGDYWIPEIWNVIGYNNFSTESSNAPGKSRQEISREAQININPYEYAAECIKYILGRAPEGVDLQAPLKDDIDPTKTTIYSMLPRTTTSWNHRDQGDEPGTLLKTICILPYLKESLDIGVLCTLPPFKYSDLNKKGEIGSPYAIMDPGQIDPNLHDDILGSDKGMVDKEFDALIEACHALGMGFMVDYVFRTAARDSDLMLEHPEWFYWIGKQHEKDFAQPRINGINEFTPLNKEVIGQIYTPENEKAIKEHIAKFSKSPDQINPELWKAVLAEHKETGESILTLVERDFGITTCPGTTDVINDPQPPWSDVTYLRFDLGLHPAAKNFLKAHGMEEPPPYMLYDIAKTSMSGMEIPNDELFKYIIDVIPSYQRRGMDWSRVDMGHAMPPYILQEIDQAARRANPNVRFWSEETFPTLENTIQARDGGASFLTGGSWFTLPLIEQEGFYDNLVKDFILPVIPVLSALENPDTPRAAFRYKTPESVELAMMVSSFMPNSVPFINSGQEVMERQPMNLGLGTTPDGQFAPLPDTDPMHGKLAFFDNYTLHWTNTDEHNKIKKVLENMKSVRTEHGSLIKSEFFINMSEQNKGDAPLFILYHDKNTGEGAFLLANRSSEIVKNISQDDIRQFLREGTKTNAPIDVEVVLSSGVEGFHPREQRTGPRREMNFKPSGYIIGRFNSNEQQTHETSMPQI